MSGATSLFGTDGIRGRFGTPPLDVVTVRRLGRVLASFLAAGGARPCVVLGGDTRDSSPTLCHWLSAGLEEAGASTAYLGTVPTPAVAHAVAALDAACGIAISASHNPHPDNGIKLVDQAGFKWSSDAEAALEMRLAGESGEAGEPPAPRLPVKRQAVDAYLGTLVDSVPPGRPLAGLRLAIDAANGAASLYAEGLFSELGAEVSMAHDAPDGRNINDRCGSTHPDVIAEWTRDSGCDLGLAFDGDADRVILADAHGRLYDGDDVLYLWAGHLQAAGRLPGNKIVATSMSNLGLEVALRRQGLGVVRCDVGDREVVAAMRREGIILGGEQSGHIVHLGLSTTGDGLLTGLQMANLQASAGVPLAELTAGFHRFPQLLRNVPVRRKPELASLPRIMEVKAEIERRLDDAGRLVLRYSGTEPLARIMIEGREQEEIEGLAQRLAVAIEQELG